MSVAGEQLKVIKNDTENNYSVKVLCGTCRHELNSTKPHTGAEVWQNWTMICLSQPLTTKSCPNGCRSTASDCNANVSMVIVREDGTVVATEE